MNFNKLEIIFTILAISFGLAMSQGDYSRKMTIYGTCLLYTSPSPRDLSTSRMPSSA